LRPLSRLLKSAFGREPAAEEPGEGTPPKVIVGLGNPGPAYSQSRHNVGFWCINRLARRAGVSVKGGGLAAVGRAELAGHEVLLVKPRTYVNESGKAVAALLERHGLSPAELLVICDDLDLPPGKLRIRARGSHGGQKGLESIVRAIRSEDFPRLRIGIGRPLVAGEPSWDPEAVADYVLSEPPPSEHQLLRDAVARADEAVVCILEEGIERAMGRFN
jgi:PTH1 family peptidyl-tRNA hydrolase